MAERQYHPSLPEKKLPASEKTTITSFLAPPGSERHYNPFETIADSLRTTHTPEVRGHTIFSSRSAQEFDSVSHRVMMNDAVNTRNPRQIWHTYSRLVGKNPRSKDPLFRSSLYFRIIRAFQASKTQDSAKWARKVYEDMREYHKPRIMTLNTLLDILIRHEDTQWAIDYFKREAAHFDMHPNTRSYNIMIRGLASSGQHEAAKKIYCDMRMGVLDRPDVTTYSTLMGHYTREDMHDEADKILDEMFRDGVKPNMWIFNSVVKRFVDKKDFAGARKVMTLMKESNFKPDVVTYSTLIDGYSREGNEAAIAHIQSEMALNEVYPNEKTITSTINVFARADLEGDIDSRLEAVLKCLPEGEMKDTTFGVLMNVYGKRKDLDAAMGIYRHIVSKGRSVNDHIINSLLDGYIRAEQIPTANKIFHDHFTVHGNRPTDSKTYSIMITGCCKQGNLTDALYYFREMTRFNIEPDAVIYSRLIQLYLQHHQLDNAQQMLRRMRDAKMAVSVQTFTMLMGYLSDTKDFRGALRYYQQMLDAGVQPDCHCYTVLINTQIRAKNFAGCERAYETMIKAGVKPTLQTYTSMIHVHSLQGNIDKVKEQWVAMTDAGLFPDIKSFTLLMRTYSQQSNVEMVEFIFKEVARKDIQIDTVTLTSLMSAYADLPHLNVGRIEEISGMLYDLELEPTPEYFQLLLDMYGRHRMPDRVIRTWRELQGLDKPLNWIPSTNNMLHLIEACRERGYIDTLHSIWRVATQGPRQKQRDDHSDNSTPDVSSSSSGPRPILRTNPEVFTAYLNALLTHNRFTDIEQLLKVECQAMRITPRTEDFELLFTGLAQYGFLKKELQSAHKVVTEMWPAVQPLIDTIIANTRKI
ncbi:hypothetical protein BGZ74_006127 [Mortierella antarctica]|nr:hypothetical protein BGZ74_006127 [Mortierella antarctica]